MREIKFRVWDNGAKMYQQMSAMMNVHTGHVSDLPERHLLEQFTGLNDKNGREIYEGDIVMAILPNDREHKNWEIKATNTGEYNIIRSLVDITVIGNIHENPELII